MSSACSAASSSTESKKGGKNKKSWVSMRVRLTQPLSSLFISFLNSIDMLRLLDFDTQITVPKNTHYCLRMRQCGFKSQALSLDIA